MKKMPVLLFIFIFLISGCGGMNNSNVSVTSNVSSTVASSSLAVSETTANEPVSSEVKQNESTTVKKEEVKSETTTVNDEDTESDKTWTEPWRIVFPYAGTAPDQNDNWKLMAGLLYDKFGIELVYSPVAGNLLENAALWLATNDLPELVHLQEQSLVAEYVAAGALISIEPYLNNIPNFVERFRDTIPYWRMMGNGELYIYQSYLPRILESDLTYEIVDIAVRTDLLEKAGWPTLVSASDWYNFLVEYVPDAVDINNKPIEGITFNGGDTWGLEGAVPIMYEKSEDYIAINNGSYTFDYKNERFEDFFKNRYVKESFEFFNRFYCAGLLDPDSWTSSIGDNWELMKTGSVAAAWYANDGFLPAINKALEEAGHPEMSYIVMPIQSDSMVAEGQKRSVRQESTRYVTTHGLTTSCKHPERFLEVLDYLSTDEGQILFRSGIEGVHWEYKNGVRTALPPLRELTGELTAFIGDLVYFNELAADGLPHNLNLTMEVYTERNNTPRQIEAFNSLGWEGTGMGWYTDHITIQFSGIPGAIIISPDDVDIQTLSTQMTDFRSKRTYDLITADNFEESYAAAIAEYDMLGGDVVIEYLNNRYKEMSSNFDRFKVNP